jgi:hypothetical protein
LLNYVFITNLYNDILFNFLLVHFIVDVFVDEYLLLFLNFIIFMLLFVLLRLDIGNYDLFIMLCLIIFLVSRVMIRRLGWFLLFAFWLYRHNLNLRLEYLHHRCIDLGGILSLGWFNRWYWFRNRIWFSMFLTTFYQLFICRRDMWNNF